MVSQSPHQPVRPRRHLAPQAMPAQPGHEAAQPLGPEGIAAEFAAPAHQAAGQVVQSVFDGEADGAVHPVRDGHGAVHGDPHAQFGRRDFEAGVPIIQRRRAGCG